MPSTVAAEITQPMARIMGFRTIHVKMATAMPTMVDMMMKITRKRDFIMVGRVIERVIVVWGLRVEDLFFSFRRFLY